ncbi:MAG: phosphatase [Firmicutes bacterium]|nr:phosphatase [Bacillota bacterium]
MKVIADMHTHSIVSGHAYSTLQENLQAAAERGLLYMATTEHGPAMPHAPHRYYFGNLRVLPDEIYGVRLIKGIEANVLNVDGELDLSDRYLKKLEYVAVGLHSDCIQPGSQESNTRALLAAMRNPNVDAIVHPGNPRFPIDFCAVLAAASEQGILIEINNSSLLGSRRGSEERCREIAELAAKNKMTVVLGSDAHWSGQVGKLDLALKLALEAGIQPENIINLSAASMEAYLAKRRQRKQGGAVPIR